jgi:hypothetical protein
MPKCSYCNRVFKDQQALGSHIKTHLDDSDEDLPLPNQMTHKIETTTQILNNQNLPERACKRICIDQNSNLNIDESIDNNSNLNIDESVEQNTNLNIDEPIEEQEFDDFDFVLSDYDSQSSNSSDEESVVSDLSYITDVNADEYNEYDALFTGILNNPDNLYQNFPSGEYAEFMHMMTKFHVQNPLANAFIRFFNKYSNRDDNPLPSSLQAGREFMENLQLPNFGWRRESIFEYKEKEYIFEYRTVLDGIHQILTNKDITKEFIFKYSLSTKDVSIIYLNICFIIFILIFLIYI